MFESSPAMAEAVSVVIPAFNEEAAVGVVIDRVRQALGERNVPHEVLVVDDGSTDATADVARSHGAMVVSHPENAGYGRSLKTGIRHAAHDLVAITDADGTYPVERLPDLLALADRFDMVVGRRTGPAYSGDLRKRVARAVFRWLAEFAVGRRIPDINSGLRVFRRKHVLPFFPHISSGFSFTTTVTLVYMLSGLFVHYVPIEYRVRQGRTKVRHVRDTLRALQIIVEAILRCNPIKVFLLLALPLTFAAALMAVVAAVQRSWPMAFVALLFLQTAVIVLSGGFATVALLPRPVWIDESVCVRESRPQGGTPNGGDREGP
jgi:glycosyltransferase involved in cell wall biosynthesis